MIQHKHAIGVGGDHAINEIKKDIGPFGPFGPFFQFKW